MRSLSQIHLADAEQAVRNGAWAAALGHCMAAGAAGAASAATAPTLQIALSEGRSMVEAAANPIQTACFLAIKAMATGEAAALDALTGYLADQADVLSLEAAAAATERTDSLAVVTQCFDRLVAIGELKGLDLTSARREAASGVISRVNALAARDPTAPDIRAFRFQALQELGRFRDALNDLRFLRETQPHNPFVYGNLIALLRTPNHEEVRASLPYLLADLSEDPKALEREFLSLLACEAIPEAFQVLDRLIVHAPEYRMIRDLRAMADDLEQEPAHKFGVAPSGRHLIYANMVCWGGKYLDLMEEIAVASMLSPQNFPALCANNDLVIDFVTMPEDAPRLLASPRIQALARLCEIRVYLFPAIEDDFRQHAGRLSYLLFGAASAFTMKRAERDGADLIFLIPDVVYAEGSFAYVASLVTKEPRALMADGLNTAAAPMLAALERHRDRARSSLSISIPDLIEYAAQHFMPRTTDFYFDPDKPDVASHPQRVIFREKEGLVVHTFSKLAIYVSHAAYAPLGQMTYGTPDAFLTNHLMKNLPKQRFYPTDGDLKFLMMELADDRGRLWARTNKPIIDAIEDMYRHYGVHINSFDLFDIGERYPVRAPYSDRLTTAAHREEFLAALREARRTRTVFTELCTERARHDRTAKDAVIAPEA